MGKRKNPQPQVFHYAQPPPLNDPVVPSISRHTEFTISRTGALSYNTTFIETPASPRKRRHREAEHYLDPLNYTPCTNSPNDMDALDHEYAEYIEDQGIHTPRERVQSVCG
jgi:hypothetical protein